MKEQGPTVAPKNAQESRVVAENPLLNAKLDKMNEQTAKMQIKDKEFVDFMEQMFEGHPQAAAHPEAIHAIISDYEKANNEKLKTMRELASMYEEKFQATNN